MTIVDFYHNAQTTQLKQRTIHNHCKLKLNLHTDHLYNLLPQIETDHWFLIGLYIFFLINKDFLVRTNEKKVIQSWLQKVSVLEETSFGWEFPEIWWKFEFKKKLLRKSKNFCTNPNYYS